MLTHTVGKRTVYLEPSSQVKWWPFAKRQPCGSRYIVHLACEHMSRLMWADWICCLTIHPHYALLCHWQIPIQTAWFSSPAIDNSLINQHYHNKLQSHSQIYLTRKQRFFLAVCFLWLHKFFTSSCLWKF